MPVPSTLTVSNFLQLGRRSGGRPQRTVYPRRLPVNTVIDTTSVGLEPTTVRLLVRRATSSATDSLCDSEVLLDLHTLSTINNNRSCRIEIALFV